MFKLSTFLGRQEDADRFKSLADRYAASVDANHFFPGPKGNKDGSGGGGETAKASVRNMAGYYDYGEDSGNRGRFRKHNVIQCKERGGEGRTVQTVKSCPAGYAPQWEIGDGRGGVLQREVLEVPAGGNKAGLVKHVGYVALFPLLLKVLPASSERLAAVLDMLESSLLTPWGIRSLAKGDLYFAKENGPGDAPYWRGPIWMPINYLAASALHHYGNVPGPSQEQASRLYAKLRKGLVSNVMKEYQRTGYLWEQYNDGNGAGQRSHPFTGWTALIVNIMAEKY